MPILFNPHQNFRMKWSFHTWGNEGSNWLRNKLGRSKVRIPSLIFWPYCLAFSSTSCGWVYLESSLEFPCISPIPYSFWKFCAVCTLYLHILASLTFNKKNKKDRFTQNSLCRYIEHFSYFCLLSQEILLSFHLTMGSAFFL